MFRTFKKEFQNLNSAISGVMDVSRSLEQSDFWQFKECKSIFDVERLLKSGDLDDSWASFGTAYYENEWWKFYYSTCSGTNQVSILSKGVDGPIYVHYYVDSCSGIYDSSSAKSALSQGWALAYQNEIDWSFEDLARRRKMLAKKQQLRKHGPNLEMHFDVHFEEIHGQYHVLGHSMHVNADDDIENVGLVPEYAAHFRALAEKELDRVFVVPDEYEYNELTRKGGENSFYAQKFREYQTGLRKLIAVCEELEKSTPQVEVQLTEPKPKRAPRKPRAERSRS